MSSKVSQQLKRNDNNVRPRIVSINNTNKGSAESTALTERMRAKLNSKTVNPESQSKTVLVQPKTSTQSTSPFSKTTNTIAELEKSSISNIFFRNEDNSYKTRIPAADLKDNNYKWSVMGITNKCLDVANITITVELQNAIFNDTNPLLYMEEVELTFRDTQNQDYTVVTQPYLMSQISRRAKSKKSSTSIFTLMAAGFEVPDKYFYVGRSSITLSFMEIDRWPITQTNNEGEISLNVSIHCQPTDLSSQSIQRLGSTMPASRLGKVQRLIIYTTCSVEGNVIDINVNDSYTVSEVLFAFVDSEEIPRCEGIDVEVKTANQFRYGSYTPKNDVRIKELVVTNMNDKILSVCMKACLHA